MRRQRVGMLVDPLRRLLRRGALGHVANLLSKLHGADVARLTGFLNEDESREVMVVLLRDVPELAADVFSELGPVAAVRYFEGMEDSEITNVLAELASDDAAVLVSALPEDVAERILLLLERENRRQVEGLLGYEEETAGRIMSPQVFALHEDDSVGQAIDALRTSRSEELEMVFYLYVVDDRGHLVGVCSLRDLLLSDPRDTLKSVMRPRVMAVGVDTDQEEVARIVARYDYLAVPVVDDENKLVGIITVDDIIDIIREEESEDILLMAGVGEDEQEVLMAPLWRNTWLRLPWLFTAWIGGVLASQVIGHFEGLLTEVVALAAFIPVIAGMGGNVGTQASTVVVRGLATGRLTPGHTWAAVLREMRVALTLGIIFGLLLTLTTYYLFPKIPLLGAVVGMSITSSMALASAVGASTPILLRRFGVDPAIATGPFVTTAIDVLGVIAYFTIASAMLL